MDANMKIPEEKLISDLMPKVDDNGFCTIYVLTDVDSRVVTVAYKEPPQWDEQTYNIFKVMPDHSIFTKPFIHKVVDGELISDSDFELTNFKTGKVRELKSRCESEIEKGFTATNGHFYRTNRDDQTNMLGQFNAISTDPLIETVMWKTEDAGYISHTREGWLDIYNQAFTHKHTQLFKYDTLKKQVNDAKTHEELTAITWDEPETTTTTTQG